MKLKWTKEEFGTIEFEFSKNELATIASGLPTAIEVLNRVKEMSNSEEESDYSMDSLIDVGVYDSVCHEKKFPSAEKWLQENGVKYTTDYNGTVRKIQSTMTLRDMMNLRDEIYKDPDEDLRRVLI